MGKTILTTISAVLVATLVLASLAITVSLIHTASAQLKKACPKNSPEGQDTTPGDNVHGCGPDHLIKLK